MHDELRVSDPLRSRVLPCLPVLRRRPGEIQVGLDPRHATVVGGLPEPLVRTLTGHPTDIPADSASAEALRDVYDGLRVRGLLASGEPLPGRLAAEETPQGGDPAARGAAAVAVQGDGRLAVSVARLLVAAGVGWVHITANGRVGPEDIGTGYVADDVGSTRSSAAERAVRGVDGSVRTARLGRHRQPDLVLLTDAVVPDPELVTLLTASRVPHLPVYVRDGIGVVGPLVVPGLTSCLRCADLFRSELDDCWPSVATQLAGRAQPGDLACTQATAAFAVGQALDTLRFPGCPRPTTWNTSVEIEMSTLRTRFRSWRPHPECPCRRGGLAGHAAPELAANSTMVR